MAEPIAYSIINRQPVAGSLGGGTGGGKLPGRTHFAQEEPPAAEQMKTDADDEYSFEIQV
jgi:hypothetical protein